MSLKSKVEEGIKNAMRAKDQDTLRALRAIKSLILLEETKSGSAEGSLSADDELKLLTKAAKQRRESAEIYKAQGREDLLVKEEAELATIEQFLPKQLTEEEVKARLQDIIARVGASSPADMGKVMGVATKELAGQADGKVVSGLVKSLLAS
ncbi:GatB/YqeY domain-containing protein [Arundinibacter roseus]|uniref:GatB/YqeY domain-containing protein n=1 Tax=Arundinibacter roseus TaxID=2070510 RepID=A0A4R4KGP1_9BACT|nr:GatB/YqeY domain-containing protein [Arundinibacter roseus]TDB66076.1 GatB/YqeY domain-containing protein [Arundinibacter roseus]